MPTASKHSVQGSGFRATDTKQSLLVPHKLLTPGLGAGQPQTLDGLLLRPTAVAEGASSMLRRTPYSVPRR